MTERAPASANARRFAVENESRGVELHPSAELADDPVRRMLGFMFADPSGRALVFDLGRTTTLTIHTFFVRAPLDLITLDYERRITARVHGLAPFRIWSAPQPVRWLLEFGAGQFAETDVEVGDRLAFALP